MNFLLIWSRVSSGLMPEDVRVCGPRQTLRAGPVGTADESPSLMLDLELFVGPPFAAAFRAAVHWLVFVGVL